MESANAHCAMCTSALEWCLTARKFPAREAAGTGLFSHIVPKGQALTTAMNLAEAMVANSSHQSLVFIKVVMRVLDTSALLTMTCAAIVVECAGARDAASGASFGVFVAQQVFFLA